MRRGGGRRDGASGGGRQTPARLAERAAPAAPGNTPRARSHGGRHGLDVPEHAQIYPDTQYYLAWTYRLLGYNADTAERVVLDYIVPGPGLAARRDVECRRV